MAQQWNLTVNAQSPSSGQGSQSKAPDKGLLVSPALQLLRQLGPPPHRVTQRQPTARPRPTIPDRRLLRREKQRQSRD